MVVSANKSTVRSKSNGYNLPVNLTETLTPENLNGDFALLFGPFRLFTKQGLLLEGDKPVRLGSRALDILIVLVEAAGELISKNELMARVWPDTNVEPANLTVHIAALRRALSDGRAGNRYLVNIPGRGYRFVAPVTVLQAPAAAPPASNNQHNLPACLTPLIGRSDVLGSIDARLSLNRLISVTGPAGIGKTAVALDVAEKLIPDYEHGVWLIDLARITEPRLVPTALASALGLEIRSDNPYPGLITALKHKQMLLVLDNCEHLIEASAILTMEILQGARGLKILATSREPLRVEGEQVYRLSALESPSPSALLGAGEALAFPAIQLFVERAAATMNNFELIDDDVASAIDICRKLDGIPLAIEFAAARVDTFGVRGLAALLDDRLQLLTGSRRATASRHQTISAALDWSYHLLGEEEQMLFLRLSIFVGGFTLDAALAVAADTDWIASDIADRIASLVTKSLIATDVGSGTVRFRLFEITRVYALSKLEQSGERNAVSRRHAKYYRDLLETAGSGDPEAGLARFEIEIDNVRAALDWAFAPNGDRSLAVAMAAASAPIWLDMSLLTECHDWMGKAIDAFDDADRGTPQEMVLQTVFGISLMFAQGMSTAARAALTRASELAERHQNPDYQLRALNGLTLFRIRLGDTQAALALARRSEAIAHTLADPVALSTADCMLSSTLLALGDCAGTVLHAKRARDRSSPLIRRAQIARLGIDQSVQAGCVLAHALWYQGLLDQSAKLTRTVLADARARSHPVSLCFSLVWGGCIVSLGRGDIETAEYSIMHLKELAEVHGFRSYYACALGFEGQLAAKRGALADGERLLLASLDGLRQTQYEVLYAAFLGSLAEILTKANRLDDGLAAINEAIEQTGRNHAFGWVPDAMRIKGEIFLERADMAIAEDQFLRSLEMAHSQGNLWWELQTAMRLARLRRSQGRVGDARDLLRSIYRRFTEGFGNADLQSAKFLLDEWA
ncbi:winged helix-turn-helix domain-containing protein [Bradyrhizobium sp. dw_78]|uniref:ATP-binding protein n=1 Tax=Bradyrhizobium sp. dw_78 TaxID=2719793 RepID=UPI001BD24C65|nr:winged helix-turn-helix domain-containing protein [Bradyrhizobium sp. dw_78]